MSEVHEIKIGGEVYKVRELSDYKLLKILERNRGSDADLYRDLVLAAVVEPKLSKEDIEEKLGGGKLIKLGISIMDIHGKVFEEVLNPENLPEWIKNLNVK